MKRWQPRARMAIVAVASFVLLVTVLPEVASSIGLTALANRIVGSESCVGTTSSVSSTSAVGSGGGSSMCCGSSSSSSSVGGLSIVGSLSPVCGDGSVTGTVKVTGAPKKFEPPFLGAGACPAADTTGVSCADPQYALASNGVYTLSLAPGRWTISGFYENSAFGGAFLGAAHTITVASGATVDQDLTVPYKKPATLTGTITVKNVPAGVTVEELTALLCPSFAPYNGVTPSIACVTGYGTQTTFGASTATFSVAGLPPGQWTAYPSFCATSGCSTNAKKGVTLTLVGGQTSTVNLSTDFLLPGQSFLTGTISVTGAPAGFADVVGITTCGGASGDLTACSTLYQYGSNQFGVVLPAGAYTVKGFYLASPYDNAVDGPTQAVALVKRKTTNVDLTVPYQVPGTATGSIVVKGLPSGVSVETYTVVACPAADPWTGGEPAPECASEYSGTGGYGYGPADRGKAKSANAAANPPPGVKSAAKSPDNVYSFSSLTPGTWLLYPSYQTILGSGSNMKGQAVSVVAGKSTAKNVSVTYQQPTDGAVTGVVNVVGAPTNGGFSSGVEACTAAPTATSCPGEQEAYAEQGGSYALLLPPGTWWLAGFVDLYTGTGESQSISPSKEKDVVVDTVVKKNFTVTIGAS